MHPVSKRAWILQASSRKALSVFAFKRWISDPCKAPSSPRLACVGAMEDGVGGPGSACNCTPARGGCKHDGVTLKQHGSASVGICGRDPTKTDSHSPELRQRAGEARSATVGTLSCTPRVLNRKQGRQNSLAKWNTRTEDTAGDRQHERNSASQDHGMRLEVGAAPRGPGHCANWSYQVRLVPDLLKHRDADVLPVPCKHRRDICPVVVASPIWVLRPPCTGTAKWICPLDSLHMHVRHSKDSV